METFIAKTFQGLEPVLAQELRDMGATEVEELTRAVSFKGDMELLFRANMGLRTALRILLNLDSETVRNQDELYNFVKKLNWMRWLTPKESLAVHAVINQADAFNNSTFVAMKVKDAIVDQFRQYTGERPSVQRDNPDIQVYVHIFREQCSISIDCSGESLHRRGYRSGGHAAPLNEVLAAGMVILSGWDKNCTFLDPMCGSGTILTEAALYACNKAPNVHRQKFGMHYWKNFDHELFEKVRQELLDAEVESDVWLYGWDINRKAIEEARQNISGAGVDDMIRLSVGNFFEKEAPAAPGIIISNPPYGERMGQEAEIAALYKEMGDQFKKAYSGYTAWLISSNMAALKRVGLRPSKKIPLFNAALECRFVCFELYQGTKRVEERGEEA